MKQSCASSHLHHFLPLSQHVSHADDVKMFKGQNFETSEDGRMAGACGMWRVGVFIENSYTYLLHTPLCRVLLEKLTGLQLIKKFPSFLWNPKVHYRTHKRRPPVPILCQPNPVHIPTPHLLEIHPNIIHPSTPRSPQWSLSLRFPHQDPVRPHLLTHTRHMPSPSHSSRFYHPHNIGRAVQII